MSKRIAAFIGLVAVLVCAVGFAAAGTGAYFSDTESGTVTSDTGTLAIEPGSIESLNMTFDNLMPGEAGQSKTATFTNTSSKAVKVYLRTHTVAVPSGVSNGQAPKLAVYIDGSVFAGLSANPGSLAAVDAGFQLVPAGGTFTVNAHVALSADANNEWQGKESTVSFDVIAQQPEAPAPTT